jgi:hypothetical protein
VDKKAAVSAVVAVIVVSVIIMVALYGGASKFEEKVKELEIEGFPTQEYPGSFDAAKADRVGIAFSESNWWEFKQQVATVKENLGFVTVWTHEDEGVLWVHSSEDQCYYYHVD